MCLLFLFISGNPLEDKYKLILVSNRDEFYSRPTKNAHFWGTHPNILAGMDMEPSREGGTWLGISEFGKVGCLLNILQPANPRIQGMRGHLVVDFIKGNCSGGKYIELLHEPNLKYNPFNIILLEPVNSTYSLTYYNNIQGESRQMPPGIYGFGSCLFDKPYQKVNDGKEKFSKIVCKFVKKGSEFELIQELLSMMQENHTPFKDPIIEERGVGLAEDMLLALSCRNVTYKDIYGTRCTTVILVDGNDKITFHEKSLQSPVTCECNDANFVFNIKN